MNPRLRWYAMVFMTLLFFVLGLPASPEVGDFERHARDQYVPVLYGMAACMFLFGWFVVRRIIRGNELVRMTCALASFEACAMFGLLALILTKDWRLYLFPWALAIVGFIREYPRASVQSTA